MIIGEQNMDMKRLTGHLKLHFLTEIGRFHLNQGEEVAHINFIDILQFILLSLL
jgi:hypothetical protein